MALLPATKKIIEEVERLTMRPVQIQEDPSLKVLASIQVARDDAPLHLVRYRPAGVTPPDYLIAYQCGFVIRLYEAPPEKRFDYGPSEDGHHKLNQLLADAKYSPAVRGMGDHLLEGLVTQMRSIAVGLRVDDWILASYPELRELQVAATRAQLDQNVRVIPLGAKGVLPAKVWKANITMNAAFAAFWARKWTEPALTVPYKAAGLLDGGLDLLKILDTASADPAHDPDLVERWSIALGLKGWYSLQPHRLND
jgi:hypothetical protein